jgi:hypothetical protein
MQNHASIIDGKVGKKKKTFWSGEISSRYEQKRPLDTPQQAENFDPIIPEEYSRLWH